MTARFSPLIASQDAQVRRKSWMVRSFRPARFRIRHHHTKQIPFLRDVSTEQGLVNTQALRCGRDFSISTKAGGSGTTCGLPFFVVGFDQIPCVRLRSHQRITRASPPRQPVNKGVRKKAWIGSGSRANDSSSLGISSGCTKRDREERGNH